MSNRGGRNNILAGVFILFFIVAGVAVTLVLAGVREGLVSRSEYTVRFNLADGAEGLEVGSLVKVGGRKVGKVLGLEFFRQRQSDLLAAIDVRIGIASDVRLYRNARIYLQLPLLGSQSQINIPFAGDPALLALKDGDTGVVRPGELLDGKLAPPAFLSQAGYGEEQSDQLRLILKRTSEFADRLASIARKTDEQLDTSLPAFTQAMTDIRAMVGEFRGSLGQWLPLVKDSLDNLKEATNDSSLGVKDIRRMIEQFQRLLENVTPRIESIVKNVDDFSGKVNSQLYDKLVGTVDTGTKALEEFRRVGAKAGAMLDQSAPELEHSLENIRLASDQLKLALTEIRRNPWRLLYQPGKKEIAEELLLDSARTYAFAVSNLQAASASLERLMAAARASGQQVDEKTMKEITNRINAAFEQYRAAEKDFLDRFMKSGGEQP